MHVQSCCLLIRLRHTYPSLFGNGYFFLRLSLPSILIDPVKTVTENARSQKRSRESRFLKTSAFLLRVNERKRFRVRNTMMSYIIYFQNNACAVIKLWYFHRFSVFVWTGDYDSNMLRVVTYLFENAFLPLSSLVRPPNYCLTNLFTSMLMSRFLVSSLFRFLLYFRKMVVLIIGFTILILSLLVCFLLCHCN